MNAFGRLESLLERLVENGFAHVARAKLQPIEIAKQAARAMERQQTVGVTSVLVPNYYDIWLNPADYARFATITGTLQAETATYLQHYAAQRSFTMPGAPVVSLGEDPGVPMRHVHVEARLEDPRALDVAEREEGIQATSVMPAAPVLPTPALLAAEHAFLVMADGRRHDLEPGIITIGRSLDNLISLDDKRISRYHARLRHSGGHWTLSDVGSTNGTFVNGKQIKQRTLLEGDVISFGGLETTFHQTWQR